MEDNNGCESTTTVQVEEPEELLVAINANIPSPFILRRGDSVRLTAIINPGMTLSGVQWAENSNLVDSLSPILTARPLANTIYSVAVQNQTGCVALNNITILVDGSAPVFLPTAFSPNDDGTNDFFKPFVGPEVQLVRSFEIYDRWGTRVFLAEDLSPFDASLGWDGSLNGKNLNAGVYVYRFVGELLDGSLVDAKGEVNLMR